MTRARTRPSPRALRINISDERGKAVRTGSAAGLAAWLGRAAPRSARGEISIALVSDRVMRRLNRVHRGVDRVTDVLSFPPSPGASAARPTPKAGRWLGDIAIARGLAARQAREMRQSTRTEVRILALHGLLHLLGYDHEADHGQMARLEDRLRRNAGLPSGLIRRSVRPARPRR